MLQTDSIVYENSFSDLMCNSRVGSLPCVTNSTDCREDWSDNLLLLFLNCYRYFSQLYRGVNWRVFDANFSSISAISWREEILYIKFIIHNTLRNKKNISR